MKVQHSVHLRRPAAEVFALVSDLEQQPRWMDLVDRVQVHGESACTGTRFVQHYHEGDRAREAHGEIVAVDPPRELVLAVQGEGFRATVEYRLEDAGTDTRLTQTSTVHFVGLLPRLLAPLIRRRSRQQLERYYRRLAALLEEGDGVP